MTLRILDLFSGIGGFSYAAEQLVGGFKTVQFVECNPFCQRVLNMHWPAVPIYPDVTNYTASVGSCDVITAGFPCQDLSSAGKQTGLSGERSGLFYQVIRLARELQPRFIVFENVANLVSHQGGATFQEVLFQIARAGFDAEWAVVSARDVGACHLRKRVWIVAHANHSGMEAPRSKQLAARAQQHGELDAANTSSQRLERQEYPQWRIAQQLCPDWGGYISKPVLCRGDDGLSGRVDRLKALGNAVVPQCAAVPLQRVLDLSRL
jgi:DNA (cytosine-5)-methyltransferase 1